MDSTRAELYERVRRNIGNTPYVELQGLDIPNRCKVFAKAEYRNPTGSHYDREMWRFLRALEEDRVIQPGVTRMIETTTGNSGASFAWLCRALGYPPPTIVLPEDMPYARRAQIQSFGARLILSPAGQYITGVSETFGRLIQEHVVGRDGGGLWCPKHWEDTRSGVAAMRECGEEILRDSKRARCPLDFFVVALGNGSSSRGIGDALIPENVTLVGMEPAESPIVAEYLNLPGFTEPRTGDRQHGLIGTGPAKVDQIYVNMRKAAPTLSDIVHPTTEECAHMQTQLMDRASQHVGMSSAGCVVSILRYIEQNSIKNKNFGTVFYDPAWKYL